MKKIVTLFTSLVLILQTFSFAYASDSQNKWNISYSGDFAQESAREKCVAGISNASRYDGDMSLNIKCDVKDRDENSYIEIKNSLAATIEAGRYTLEFYVRKNSSSGGGEIHLGNTVINTEDMTKTDASNAPSGETNWKKYSYTFDCEADNSGILSIRFYNRIKSYTIDEMSLTAEGGEDNLIGDPGFEEYFEDTGEDDETPYDTAPYQPKSMMFTKMNTRISLNWKNPSTDTLKKISIYDITNGDEILLTDELSTTPDKIIYYYVDNAISGVNYTYKIVFSYTDKEDYIYYMGGSPSPILASKTFSKWTFANEMGGSAKYVPSECFIDGTVAHSGDASFKMKSNISLLSEDDMNGNIYMKMQQSLPLEVGKTYKISFWLKGSEVSNDVNATMWFDLFNDTYSRVIPDSKGTFDWKYCEYDYTYGLNDAHDQNTFLMHYEGYADGIWIDDVECYELAEDGETKVGDNLFVDGGFEDLLKAENAEIRNLTAESANGGINLNWKNVGSEFEGVHIYQMVFDKYEYRGSLANGISSLNMTGLKNGKDYTFKLVPYNTDYVVGQGEEVTQQAHIADYIINKPVLTYGGQSVKEIENPGTYKLSVSAKNNTLENGLNYEMIAVLYDKNDCCEGVYSTAAKVAKKHENAPYSTSSLTFKVPEGRGQYIEVYVVDSREDFNRFYDTVVFGSSDTVYLTGDELLEILSGYSYYTVDKDGYIDLDTFTPAQRNYFSGGEFYRQFVENEQTMISFTTNTPWFKFDYKLEGTYGYLDVFVDGECKVSQPASGMSISGEYTYSLDGNEHRIDIYLPRNGMQIRNFAYHLDSYVKPIENRIKALFYGDSITYGYGHDRPSVDYVSRLARTMDYEVVNYGVPGFYFEGDQVIAQDVFEPDIIFVAYGANDTNRPLNLVEGYVKSFMDNLTAMYPTQKIYVITPIWANDSETRIQNLPYVREIITSVCSSAAYRNVTIIDGSQLVPPSSSYFLDGVHPNVKGNKLYADNLAQYLTP